MRALMLTSLLAAGCSGGDGNGNGNGNGSGKADAAAGDPDAAPQPGPTGADGGGHHVLHGWPELEPGYVLGQVAGVTIDPAGDVLVFHRADHPWFGGAMFEAIDPPTLMVLDAESGAIKARFGARKFVIPHGLHAAPGGNLWVTDVGTSLVHELSPTGEELRVLDRGFNQPTDVFVAADGAIFVADGYGNSRVVKLSPAGAVLKSWGSRGAGPGQFNVPHSITGDARGRILVADRGNSRIQLFDTNGLFLGEWKGATLGRPWAITAAADGSFYVVDGGDQNPQPPDRAGIVHLDADGHILERWSEFGNYDGQLYWGHDLAVDAQGAVYVGDVYYGMRVQKFVP